MILINKYNYKLKPKMDTLVFDIYGIILYSKYRGEGKRTDVRDIGSPN